MVNKAHQRMQLLEKCIRLKWKRSSICFTACVMSATFLLFPANLMSKPLKIKICGHNDAKFAIK